MNLARAANLSHKATLALAAALTASLIILSLRWPLVGDASVFHFAAVEQAAGAVPYRDFRDINFPLIYWLHRALIAAVGTGDLAFRLFDLCATATIAALLYLLIGPERRSAAALGAIAFVFLHLSFGPLAEGQRDFLLLVPELAAAIFCLRNARGDMLRAGAFIALATLLKPTACLLLALPLCASGRTTLASATRLGVGFLAIAAPATIYLHAVGGLEAFFATMREFGPAYAAFDKKPISTLVVSTGGWFVRLAGFALAIAIAGRRFKDPRHRIFAALVIFGVLHFLLQGKAYFYHAYPLIAALIAWGASCLPRLGPRAAMACLACLVALLLYRGAQSLRLTLAYHGSNQLQAVATQAMQTALTKAFPRGATVQMLDSDAGAFLAMARSDMRQATPDAYWFLLLGGPEEWRRSFIARLRDSNADGLLVTNTQWPIGLSFAPFESWPEMQELLRERYDLVDAGSHVAADHPWAGTSPSEWRLYAQRGQARASDGARASP